MTEPMLSPEAVAQFLKSNPEFFQQHAEIFADLRVPHPHESRAISLGERQILTLRARCKEMEWKLAGLLHNATGNERISRQLMQWCCDMLSQDDANALPALAVERLQGIFELPDVVLRLWGKGGPTPYVQEAGEAIRQYASDLEKPYCGPAGQCPVSEWLAPGVRSMACIALRREGARQAFGLLAFGSDDPARFTADMGTDFLETIGRLASAGLQRLPDAVAAVQT